MTTKAAQQRLHTSPSAAAIAGAQPNATRRVVVSAADLPLHCPLPGERLWDSHPRVYLPLQDGEQACPYCGTVYALGA